MDSAHGLPTQDEKGGVEISSRERAAVNYEQGLHLFGLLT